MSLYQLWETNTKIEVSRFSGWGQFFQCFCRSTSAYKSYHKWQRHLLICTCAHAKALLKLPNLSRFQLIVWLVSKFWFKKRILMYYAKLMDLLFENGFLGWGQFLQSFCINTRAYVILPVASPLVIWLICNCPVFVQIFCSNTIVLNYLFWFDF